jgi:hypothetical protein
MKRVLLLAAFVLIAANSFAAGAQLSEAQSIVRKYHDVPKGVVVEGVAEGIETLTSVTYDKDKNEFTINEKYTYKNPLTRKEFAQLFKALLEDDLIGVTLLEGKTKTYGKLNVTSSLVNYMADTDKLLGGIIYGIDFLLESVKLPGGYKPQKAGERKIPVVAFSNLTRFMFEKHGTEYVRVGCSLEVTLIPLADKKAAGGGHLPDEEKAKSYVMEDADRANLEHLHSHQADYFKMPEFAKSVACGEAAAFARFVRDSKIDTEVLLKSIK